MGRHITDVWPGWGPDEIMTGPNADSSRQSNGSASTNDVLFKALASQPRRLVLFHLRQHGVSTLADLVDVVSEHAALVREFGVDDERRIAMVLVEHHLPQLERYGLVVYDRLDDVVELAGVPRDFGDWLDLAIRREIHWAKSGQQPNRPGHRPTSVLLVDDEPGFADVVAELIEHDYEDMTFVTATNAPDAFYALTNMEIDCIVSDYWMPAISGLDFLEAVREEYPDLPFIIFTNKGSEEVASEAIANDVSAYVPKSGEDDQYDRLATQIRQVISR